MNAPTEPTERFFLSTGIAPGGTAYEGGTAGLDPHGGRNSVFFGISSTASGDHVGPPLTKLRSVGVYNSNFTMVYGAYNIL